MIDTHELICHLCNLDDNSTYDELEQAIFDNYEVSIDAFDAIAHALLPLVDVGKSELTGKTYKGFSVHINGYGFWLLKMEVKQ
ncbi:hypothetical protein [Acinetobacter guillouiae]|uniref:Uncharacterized protein n=1 Tax=Acinetobacter guillouiae NIPH 991 TaxID=1217656 RepID=N8YBS0_ACIGI|nr:hypothetical protein [Acinetobacter guillouiae]ENV18779.1 hypothetical protein F964_00579 [Acinetobacter guillouiae NIPH 991]